MRKALTIFVMAMMLVLGGCFYPSGGNNSDIIFVEPGKEKEVSPAAAKEFVREVIDPSDIPPPFVGCVGSHGETGRLVATEKGTSFAVIEKNRRKCPEVQLN